MRRSSTIHTLLPTDEESLDSIAKSTKLGLKLKSTNQQSITEMDCSDSSASSFTKNQSKTKSKESKTVKLDRTKSIDSASYDMKLKFENKPTSRKKTFIILLLAKMLL